MKRNVVDTQGLRCPMPLLKLKQALVKLEIGDEIELLSSDAGSWRDIPAFIKLTKHNLISKSNDSVQFCFVVVKGE